MVVSAVRAYYAEIINFENFTDSRSLLDVFSALEPATSIIVASSPILKPVIKKWFGDGHRGPSTASPPKSSDHRFQRLDENGPSDPVSSSQNIALGVKTTVGKGPRWTSVDEPIQGSGQQHGFFTDMERLAVQDGRAISVRQDLRVREEA
ncbi:MAG: hypothetical protein Q9183_001724 [Haloplaca sp. 2 TL-2023]